MSRNFGVSLIVLTVLSVVVLGLPTTGDVRRAILEAKEENAHKRREAKVECEKDDRRSACPMADFHGHGLRLAVDIDRERRSLDHLAALKKLRNRGVFMEDLRHESVLEEFARDLGDCPSPGPCNPYWLYRSPDGSCNNVNNPTWGMAGAPQLRLIQNAYDDEISEPRAKGLDGGALPNARTVSNVVHAGNPAAPEPKSRTHTVHMMQFGQFLDHDIGLTPMSEVEKCCDPLFADDLDVCLPIRVVEPDDPVFPMDHCMNFRRSAASLCPSSTGGSERQQINAITSYVDASNVYGVSQDQQDSLRKIGTGFMDTTEGDPGRLPRDYNGTCKANVTDGIMCPYAGDPRVAVTPGLTAYHTLFMREHNRITAKLQPSIPDPETLFQTARKIVIGIMQKITYDEYLPALLSPAAIERYTISSDWDYVYHPNTDAGMSTEFGIAFRFGHDSIPRTFTITKRNLNLPAVFEKNIEDLFLDPCLTYADGPDLRGMDGLVHGLTAEKSPKLDGLLVEGVRSAMFDETLDLAALNIQRGRDHGIPGYAACQMWCGLPPVSSWNDLSDHDDTVRDKLMSVYASPEDIDLFTAVVTERHVDGGSLGPTGECIIGDQFHRLKVGDRFWYQHPEFGLTADQQAAIQQYSMAKVMCNNFDFLKIHSPNIFLASNDLTLCTQIPDLDLGVFLPDGKRKRA